MSPGLSAPPPGVAVRSLLDGAVRAVALSDVRCAGVDTPPAVAESTTAFELAVVRRGFLVREYRGREALVGPGMLMVFERAQPYRIRHPIAGGDSCSVVAVPREVLDDVAPSLATDGPAGSRMRAQGVLDPRAWLGVRIALHAARIGDSLRAEEGIVRLLPPLLRQLDAPGVPDALERAPARGTRALDLTARVVDLLSRRFGDPLTLRSIARDCGTSAFHLSRVVHAMAGAPVHRLLVGYRLREAVERLLEGEQNLSHIALATGFSSHSHFTASFRAAYGVTPRQLRASLPTMRATGVRALRRRANPGPALRRRA